MSSGSSRSRNRIAQVSISPKSVAFQFPPARRREVFTVGSFWRNRQHQPGVGPRPSRPMSGGGRSHSSTRAPGSIANVLEVIRQCAPAAPRTMSSPPVGVRDLPRTARKELGSSPISTARTSLLAAKNAKISVADLKEKGFRFLRGSGTINPRAILAPTGAGPAPCREPDSGEAGTDLYERQARRDVYARNAGTASSAAAR